MHTDHAVGRFDNIDMKLVEKMFAQALLAADRLFDRAFVVFEGGRTGAARKRIGAGARVRRISRAAVGPNILVGDVERDLLAALCRAVVGPVAAVGFRALAGLAIGRRLAFALTLAALQKRILLQRFVDELRHLDVRHLQQLDGLLQLWSHNQRLRLPQIEASVERHGAETARGARSAV